MKNLNLSFLNNITDDEKILLNQIADWVYLSENKFFTKYSFFFNEKQISLCEKVLASLKCDNYRLYGGFDKAKRKVLCIYSPYDTVENDDFPIVPLLFKYRTCDNLSHRDFLGSLMALNISRNTIGDIVVSEGCTQIFVYNTVADLVENSISKIGRIGVSINRDKCDSLITKDSFEEITGTVASLRLDCIMCLALHLSREKARNVIATKEINVNYLTVNKPDFILKENDEFSVRGFGKFILESVSGLTKKNRYHIKLQKYI